MTKYIVKASLRRVGETELIDEDQYLIAIHYNPYNKDDTYFRAPIFGDTDEAFEFSTLAAAEMAAVWVGGQVEELP